MAAPRIPPGDRRQVGIVTWGLTRVLGQAAGTERPNLFLTLGRHRRLLRGWLAFARRLMPFGTLPRRETELVILRVANLCANRYELEHHHGLARRAGVTDAEVARLAEPSLDGWSERERVVLRAVDELHHQRDVADATWAELRRHLDEREAIELCLLVGHYEMLAATITALRIQPDAPRS